MSAAKKAKALGAKNLQQIADGAGVSRQNLDNWSRDKPALFAAVVVGVVELARVTAIT